MLEDFNLDLTNVEADKGFAPKGLYPVEVEKCELKDTKDGEGYYFNVQFDVIGESFKGAKFFKMFNVINKSEKAVEIGKAQLKGFMEAAEADDYNITDPSQLVGLRALAVVAPTKDGEGTEIKRFKKLSEASDGNSEGGQDEKFFT